MLLIVQASNEIDSLSESEGYGVPCCWVVFYRVEVDMNLLHKKNPFKALFSYDESDAHIFKGRDREAEALFKLVKFNSLTVLSGTSGIGKTSLIRAGLFPRLDEVGFLPIEIRLDYLHSPVSLISQVVNRIQEVLQVRGISEVQKINGGAADSFRETETLWEYFHRVEHKNGSGDVITPVLSFDQFEELFTVGRDHPDLENLKEELYCLVEDQVPAALQKRFEEDGEIYPFIHTTAAVRVLLGLREDYLPHLNRLKRRIPSIDRVVFPLIHLNSDQARQVMAVPGGIEDEGAKENILQQFYHEDRQQQDGADLMVEPSILSLLCFQVKEKGPTSLSGKGKDEILADFYDEVLRELPRSEELAEFIEIRLLTKDGFRTPEFLHRENPLRDVVGQAIHRRILRKVYYGGKEHVEIIHDVLAPVIKEKRRLRQEEKRRLEIRKELQQKKRELQQKHKFNRFALFAGVVLAVAVVVLVVLFIQAGRQKKQAVSNRLAAQASLVLPDDNLRAIRIAEAAYRIGMPHPSPSVRQVMNKAAYSTYKRPFYAALMRHNDKVTSAIFSPDETKILTISRDHVVKLWDMGGKLLAELKGHAGDINSAAFDYDGTKIITASDDNTARLWDLTGSLLATLKHMDDVKNAVFSPAGSKVLTASRDKTAKLWDLDGNLLADLDRHTAQVSSAAFSPGGSKIVTVSWDRTAKLWDLSGNLQADFKHTAHVSGAAFAPDGSKIVTGSWDCTAKLWDKEGNLIKVMKHSDGVRGATFSIDGMTLLTRSEKNVKLWDAGGNFLADMKHEARISSAVYSPDNTKILTASRDETAKLWGLKGKILTVLTHAGRVSSAIFSPDGKNILTRSKNAVNVWDLKGNYLSNLGHLAHVSSAIYASDGGKILTGSWDHKVKLWELRTQFLFDLNKVADTSSGNALLSPDGTKVLSWLGGNAEIWDLDGNLLAELNNPASMIVSAVFSEDGSKILTRTWGRTAKLWNLKGDLLAELGTSTLSIFSAVFSSDGSKVLTVSTDKTVKIWDLKGSLLANLNMNGALINSVALSPDGEKLLAWYENSVKLWDLNDNSSVDLAGHTDRITCAGFANNGLTIFTASRDRTAKLWDLNGNVLVKLNNYADRVVNACFSADDQEMITISSDGAAKLWDLDGNLLADLSKYTNDVLSAAFSTTGDQIITLSWDGTIRSWYTPEAIIEKLKTAPIPRLTQQDKKELGIENFDID